MTPRERAQLRMNRHIPGLTQGKERALASRLAARGQERESVLPGRLEVRVREEVRIKRSRTVALRSYAPQLIRLVRHPFELRPVRPQHRGGSERPQVVRREREALPRPAREMGAIRSEYAFRSPMTEHPHRPEPRPHPFARARRMSGEADDR